MYRAAFCLPPAQRLGIKKAEIVDGRVCGGMTEVAATDENGNDKAAGGFYMKDDEFR